MFHGIWLLSRHTARAQGKPLNGTSFIANETLATSGPAVLVRTCCHNAASRSMQRIVCHAPPRLPVYCAEARVHVCVCVRGSSHAKLRRLPTPVLG